MRTIALALVGLLWGCGSSDGEPAAVAAQDAGSDTSTVVDTGAADTAPGDAAVKCAPAPVTGWVPAWYPPVGLHQGKCTTAQIDELVAQCVGPGSSPTACQATRDKMPDCDKCVVSDAYAASTGALVQYKTPLDLLDRNVSGCVALKLGDVSKTGCGAKVRAATDCGLQACGPSCPFDPVKGFAALNLCVKKANADATLCKTYFDAAEACVLAAGDTVLECSFYLTGEPVPDLYKRYAQLFCGAASVGDAGTD